MRRTIERERRAPALRGLDQRERALGSHFQEQPEEESLQDVALGFGRRGGERLFDELRRFGEATGAARSASTAPSMAGVPPPLSTASRKPRAARA